MPLIDLILSGLSIYRWNTFPRVRSITALDHLGFVAHIALTVAYARKEKEGYPYDIGLLLKKVLFSGFSTFFYSDISAEVKDRIREKNPLIYQELEDDIERRLLALDIHPDIKADISLIQKKTPEDDLITFAKMWASSSEIEQNAIVYPYAYQNLLESMKLRNKKEVFEPFLAYIDFTTPHEKPLGQYLLVIHRLASSFRWNKSVRKYPVSVLSHTFIIAFLTYTIAREEQMSEETLIDMIETALLHDIPEAITGDIITPTKKAVVGLEAVIEEVEQDMVEENLLALLSGYEFREKYRTKMLTPWKENHGDIVKQADILSALHEARIEAPFSEDFREVYETLCEKVEKFGK